MTALPACRWRINGDPSLNWHTMMDRKNKELKRLSELYTKNLKSAGVEQFEGRGRITGKESVEVNGKTYKVGANGSSLSRACWAARNRLALHCTGPHPSAGQSLYLCRVQVTPLTGWGAVA